MDNVCYVLIAALCGFQIGLYLTRSATVKDVINVFLLAYQKGETLKSTLSAALGEDVDKYLAKAKKAEGKKP